MLRSMCALLLPAILLLVTGCNPVDKSNEILQSINGDLQAKRALTLSEESLKALDRVDLVLSIDKDTLDATIPDLLEKLNAFAHAKDRKLTFEAAEFRFDDQMLSLSMDLSAEIEALTVSARVQVSTFVGASAKAIHWNLYVDGIEVTDIEGLSWFATGLPEGITAALGDATPILNAVLDEAVNDNPDTALLLALNEPYLVYEDLTDHSSDDFAFDDMNLQTGLATRAAAVLITDNSITVAAKVDFVRPEEVDTSPPFFPSDADLIRQSSEGWQQRVADYQTKVRAVIDRDFGSTPVANGEATGFAASKPALARLINYQFSQGPISGTFTINEAKSNTANLTFEIKERDCGKYFAGCDYKPFCEGHRCMQEVDEVVTGTCRVSCCLQTGLLGCLIPGMCDRACNSIVKVTRPITGAACESFRVADQLYGGTLCSIASNVDKAICDIDANGRKALCDAEQELARFYRSNPVDQPPMAGPVRMLVHGRS